MAKKKIAQFYNKKYDEKSSDFWNSIELPNRADKQYVCIGVKASNYVMPKEVLSEKGPGGGGWILMKQSLAVMNKEGKVWSEDTAGYPRVFAIGA